MNQRINNGDIPLSKLKLMILNLMLSSSKVTLFEERTVSDLISGYSDFLIKLIDSKKPGLFKNGNFSLLNGVRKK